MLKLYEENDIQRIANAIRNKNGYLRKYKVAEMPDAIDALILGGTGGTIANEDGLITRQIVSYENPRVTEIGRFVFYNYNGLVAASFPSVYEVGYGAFWDCSALENVKLPLAQIIGPYAFKRCADEPWLDYFISQNSPIPIVLDLPSVKTIYEHAFEESGFTDIVLRSTTMVNIETHDLVTDAYDRWTIQAGTEIGMHYHDYNGHIYVPAILINAYCNNARWAAAIYNDSNNTRTAADVFRPLEHYTVDGTITGALDLDKI